jgi:hypothetical protein
MKIPRVTLLALMMSIGVVAVNLAVGRAILASHRSLLPGCMSSGLVLEFALFRLVSGRGRVRVFWAGFLAAGVWALASLLFPGSRYWVTWYHYFVWAGDGLKYLPEISRLVKTDHRVFLVVFALIVCLTQILLAVTGGLLALLARWGFEVHSRVSMAGGIGVDETTLTG